MSGGGVSIRQRRPRDRDHPSEPSADRQQLVVVVNELARPGRVFVSSAEDLYARFFAARNGVERIRTEAACAGDQVAGVCFVEEVVDLMIRFRYEASGPLCRGSVEVHGNVVATLVEIKGVFEAVGRGPDLLGTRVQQDGVLAHVGTSVMGLGAGPVKQTRTGL